jgi:hypothetical protein
VQSGIPKRWEYPRRALVKLREANLNHLYGNDLLQNVHFPILTKDMYAHTATEFQ